MDAYGAGDSFAAGVTTGLAAGLPIAEAIRLGARCGAACMTGRGPYSAQLDLRGGMQRRRPPEVSGGRACAPDPPGARARRGSAPWRAAGRPHGRAGDGPRLGVGQRDAVAAGPWARRGLVARAAAGNVVAALVVVVLAQAEEPHEPHDQAPTSKTRSPTMKIHPWSVIPRRAD